MSRGTTSPGENLLSTPNSAEPSSNSRSSQGADDRFHRANAIAHELRAKLHVPGLFVALRVTSQSVFVCWASHGAAPAVASSIRLRPEMEEECRVAGSAVIDLGDRKRDANSARPQQMMIMLFGEDANGVVGIALADEDRSAERMARLREQVAECVNTVIPGAMMPVPAVRVEERKAEGPAPPPALPEVVAAPAPEIQPEVPLPFTYERRKPAVRDTYRTSVMVAGVACIVLLCAGVTGVFFVAHSKDKPQKVMAHATFPGGIAPEPIVERDRSLLPKVAPSAQGREATLPLTSQVHRLPITGTSDVALNKSFPKVVSPDDLTGTTPRVEFRSQDYPPSDPPESDLPQSVPASSAPPPVVSESVPVFDLSRTFKGHSGWVTGIAFNGAGQLASGGWDKSLKVWDVNSGRSVQSASPGGKHLQAMAYSQDGKLIAVQTADDSVEILDGKSARPLRTLPGNHGDGRSKDDWVYSIAFSPDGKWLATALGNKTVRVWDVQTGRVVHDLVGSRRAVIYIAFSPGGKMLATGDDDKTIAIWDVATGSMLRTLKGHSKSVDAVAFSPDGRLLASAGADKTVRIWDYARGTELYVLRGHRERVSCLAFGPGGKWLVSGSWDGGLRVWDMKNGQRMETLEGKNKSVYTVAVDPHGNWLAAGSEDGTISLWRTHNPSANGSEAVSTD